ncbi:glycoside hydrolase family 13 protein [Raineyella sp.]|uniref:Oligo-1,6-glucosidase n=1 Tax=bioreactor metagenome TaxID=1076179 RepID=A0A644XT93_9ZZZZ|nr:glycoside hydrolase family 13 protein [Raineyella sp.]MEA5155072.1 glycoside hydrolase family 13 protein [Raineyella sp.]
MTELREQTPDRRGATDPDWWRGAVVYQVYPRSYADGDGDGQGDLAGILARLDHLVTLGVDALWISPWYPSPLYDGGYDVADYCDIDPRYGTLAEADELIARAHDWGLRIIIDLVPNHCSIDHPLFRAALAAGPGSAERELFIFRDGSGPGGDRPPNNWPAHFGGPAWERVVGPDGVPEQWYLHLFTPEQPDWNWTHPAVADLFDGVLRFWFDRGVDGFRIDVADSCAKDMTLPDLPAGAGDGGYGEGKYPGHPYFDRPELEAIHRRWRAVADEYADTPQGPRVLVSEAYLGPTRRLAAYTTEGRLHMTFNFDALLTEWSYASQRAMIEATLAGYDAVGAPATWVLGNHDQPRVASRYGRAVTGAPFSAGTGLGPRAARGQTAGADLELGRRRARAAALLELALPGGAYVYQGDELGLEEVDLPVEVLQDPIWKRSGHTEKGRDGCRVPLPWSGDRPPYGFSPADATADPWLPQPDWADRTVAAQAADPGSFLTLYRHALAIRHDHPALGAGTLRWADDVPDGVLAFDREPDFSCWVNFGDEPVTLPAGATVLLTSEPSPTGSTVAGPTGSAASGPTGSTVADPIGSEPAGPGGTIHALGTDHAVWFTR